MSESPGASYASQAEGADGEATCTDMLLCGSKGKTHWEHVPDGRRDWRKEEYWVECEPGTGTHEKVEKVERKASFCCAGCLMWTFILLCIAALGIACWMYLPWRSWFGQNQGFVGPISRYRYIELQQKGYEARDDAWNAIVKEGGRGSVDKFKFADFLYSTNGELDGDRYPSLQGPAFSSFVRTSMGVKAAQGERVIELQSDLGSYATTLFDELDKNDGDGRFTILMTIGSFRHFCNNALPQLNETQIVYAYNGMDQSLDLNAVKAGKINRPIPYPDYVHFMDNATEFYNGNVQLQMRMAKKAAESGSKQATK